MKKTPVLELRDVSYVANSKTILHSINWTVRQGEHWAILGPNGSGKTTLLK
jgi:ABC-type molybdenum transport system ATPase subunit/photorepair protein PhrA